MTSRQRFLAACACEPLDRPPVWIMRQAGRYLPEYRTLKAKSSFLEMVRTPGLAAEVTLQPMRRFALDAASAEDFEHSKAVCHSDRPFFNALMENLTAALIESFQMQIRAGADAIQIFDSWGGIIAGQDYEAASLRWIRDIIAALPKDFPIILFAKGAAAQLTDLAFSGAKVLGVDWTIDLGVARKLVPGTIALQGNLDPVLLNTTPEIVRRETTRLLETMRGAKGHIFNLGHGIMPQAKIECVEALVQTVTEWK